MLKNYLHLSHRNIFCRLIAFPRHLRCWWVERPGCLELSHRLDFHTQAQTMPKHAAQLTDVPKDLRSDYSCQLIGAGLTPYWNVHELSPRPYFRSAPACNSVCTVDAP